MHDVVIVSAKRTAIGEFGGTLKTVSVSDLGATALKACLTDAGLRPVPNQAALDVEPNMVQGQGPVELEEKYQTYASDLQPVEIDEVIMGNVIDCGQGQHITRQAAIKAGIPKETCSFTVNKVCGSGMKAVALAAQAIACGDAKVILAGGMENMSQIPYVMPSARWGARMGNMEVLDAMIADGLTEVFYGYHMGVTAENLVDAYGISREEQDQFAVASNQRALAAIAAGQFKAEIAPVEVPQRKADPIIFDTDERPKEPRPDKLASMRAAFKKDGSVTAGNASGINDGASVLLLMSAEKAAELELTPMATIKGSAAGGVDPAIMGIGPVPAVRKVLAKTGLAIGNFGAIELNEAFAAQSIAVMRELDANPEQTNRRGGAIALGHPIGASGARILVTLVHQMQQDHLEFGLASLCIGGGMGIATVLQK